MLKYHSLDELVQLVVISRRTKYNYLKDIEYIYYYNKFEFKIIASNNQFNYEKY